MLKVVPNGRTLNWHCQGLEVDLARTKAFTFNSQMSEVIFMSKKWHLGVQQGNSKKGWTPAAPAQKALPGWGCRSWKVGPRGPQRGSQGRGHSSPFRQLWPDQCLPGPPEPVPRPRALRVPIHQEDVKIINICASSHRGPEYMPQKLTGGRERQRCSNSGRCQEGPCLQSWVWQPGRRPTTKQKT